MYFIEIEGITGVGKTTLVPYLKNHLEKKGLSIFCVKEPGFTKLGLDIRQFIGDKYYNKLSNLTQMFLFLSNRADIHDRYLANCDSDIVILDRYYGSTVVYQIMMNDPKFENLYLDLLKRSMKTITGRESPVDATILLDADPKIILERIKLRQKAEFRSNNEIQNDELFLEQNTKLRKCFKKYFFENESGNHKVMINANDSIEKIVSSSYRALDSILAKNRLGNIN